MTIRPSGTITVSNIEGYDAEDKFFQVNAVGTLTNSRLHDAGTVCIGSWASCTQSGNTSY